MSVTQTGGLGRRPYLSHFILLLDKFSGAIHELLQAVKAVLQALHLLHGGVVHRLQQRLHLRDELLLHHLRELSNKSKSTFNCVHEVAGVELVPISLNHSGSHQTCICSYMVFVILYSYEELKFIAFISTS